MQVARQPANKHANQHVMSICAQPPHHMSITVNSFQLSRLNSLAFTHRPADLCRQQLGSIGDHGLATNRAHRVSIYYACQAHTLAIKLINIMYEAIYIMHVTTSTLCMYEYEYILCIQLYDARMHAKHKYACNQTRAST